VELDWESVKPRTLYLPKDVVDKCLSMIDKEQVDVCFHWDDAGSWLFAMEYSDPFVIAFMEYLTLARGNWKGGIFLSTPFKDWIIKKLLKAEGILQIKITKPPGDSFLYTWKPRIATCIEETHPYPRKVYFKYLFQDNFIAITDDNFFDWYEPLRKRYTRLAALKMKRRMEKVKTKGWRLTAEEEDYIKSMDKEISVANDKSKDFLEAVQSFERPL
jgi:hypothetical protein